MAAASLPEHQELGLSALGSGCGWNAPFVDIDNTVVFRGTSSRVSELEGTIFNWRDQGPFQTQCPRKKLAAHPTLATFFLLCAHLCWPSPYPLACLQDSTPPFFSVLPDPLGPSLPCLRLRS